MSTPEYGTDEYGVTWPLNPDGTLNRPQYAAPAPEPQRQAEAGFWPAPRVAPTIKKRKSKVGIVLGVLAGLAIVGTIAGGVIAANGGTQSNDPSTSTDIDTDDVEPIDTSSDIDTMYIDQVREGTDIEATDAQLLDTGHAVCSDLDNGMTPMGVAMSMAETGNVSYYDSGFLTGAAVSAFCPEYLDDIPSY